MLGFEVNYTGLGDGSLDALYAVTGCKTPMDSNNRGCTGAPGLEVVILNPNPKRVMTSHDEFIDLTVSVSVVLLSFRQLSCFAL